MTKIVFISDVHQQHKQLVIPECDILVSAGDYSFQGQPQEIEEFHKWFDKQPAEHLISVQGNHEVWVERNFEISKKLVSKICPRAHFVDEGLVEINDLKFWCSAVTPFFCDWAWNVNRGSPIRKHWDLIPEDADILVTHGPVANILDETLFGEHVGCWDLHDKIKEIKPKIHASGHIHPSYGTKTEDGILFLNASVCDEEYNVVNLPIVVEIDADKKVTPVLNIVLNFA